jgi:lysine 6-dehydrogenase
MSGRIAVVGAGQMGLSAISILAEADPGLTFRVFDRDPARLEAARSVGPAVRSVVHCDIFSDPVDLAGENLVLNFAGPFFTGSDTVARRALSLGVPYVDVGDDVEATQAILALDGAAQAAGVPIITGAGLSPGVSNWLAMQIIAAHPACDAIKIAWTTHEPNPGGLAPLRHMLHMAVSPCPVWADGRIAYTRGFVPETREDFTFPEPFGRIGAQDTSHPEPFTLGRTFPHLKSVVCKGSLQPEWANAAFSTLGRIGFGYHGERVAYGEVAIEPAEFLWRLMWQRHRNRPPKDGAAATGVMVIGLRHGEVVETRTIVDDGDMSRGTGLGAAAAALGVLAHRPRPGAGGVEMLDPERGVADFLRLARARGTFKRGVIVTR